MTQLGRVLAALYVFSISWVPFGCNRYQEEATTPPARAAAPAEQTALQAAGVALDQLSCNQATHWAPGLMADTQRFAEDVATSVTPYLRAALSEPEQEALRGGLSDLARNWMIRTVLVHGNLNNLGASVIRGVSWQDEANRPHPLVLFHSGVTPNPEATDSCFRSLLGQAGVRHVVNLYDGELPLQDLIEAEQRVAEEAGASYTDAAAVEAYRGWRSVVGDDEATEEQRQQAMITVARLIREQVLEPQGQPLRGNVYVHCGGGMHRSATIFGVLRHCLGGDEVDLVRTLIQQHSSYVSEAQPGGYEPAIVEFIRNFDCSLLQLPPVVQDGQQAPTAG